MIDAIGSTPSTGSTQRTQAASAPQGLRNNPVVLNAIVQTQQRASNATVPVKASAVAQATKAGVSANVKLPRGSLVDVLA